MSEDGSDDIFQIDHAFVGFNPHLVGQVPLSAKKIVDIGCGDGSLGAQIKTNRPEAVVYGVELNPRSASEASLRLDRVFCANVESDSFHMDQEKFDCILFGDVIEHLYYHVKTIKKVRSWLEPDGCVVCCIPNVQHYSLLTSLLRGDFQYHIMGLLAASHIRFFTHASSIKMLLDGGYIPELSLTLFLYDNDNNRVGPTPEFFDLIKRAIALLGSDPVLGLFYTSVFQYVFKGTINPSFSLSQAPTFPISFIVISTNKAILDDNLTSSPIFQREHPHQIIVLEKKQTMGHAIAEGIAQAEHDFIVFVQQDVYLPSQWDSLFCQQVLQASALIHNAGVFGVYGANNHDGQTTFCGALMDRLWYKKSGGPLPAPVETVDPVLVGFRKQEFSTVVQSVQYWTCISEMVSAYQTAGKSAVVVDALCFHNAGWMDQYRAIDPMDLTILELGNCPTDFIHAVFREGVQNPLAEIGIFVQQNNISPQQIISIILYFLAKKEMAKAFMVALLFDANGYCNPVVSLALGVGGIMLNRAEDAARGLENLRTQKTTLKLETEQQDFYQRSVVPLMIDWMDAAVSSANGQRVMQLLAIYDAATPRL